MADKLQFREKLAGILELCQKNQGMITKEEVEKYFQEDELTKEQMDLVYDYLLSQKIIVKGYVKSGGTVRSAEGENESQLSTEEKQYLETYESELKSMPSGTPVAYYLPKVVEIARELHRPDVYIGDLVQEGNVGLMVALEQEESTEEEILMMVRESIQTFLESQTEAKLQDKKMADRVNSLDEQIKRLTEEMGRKVSVDELAQFSDMKEEEILDLLKLAGEEAPEEE